MDGFVVEPAKTEQTECNINVSKEKASTKKHQMVKVLESPVLPQGMRQRSSQRCHLLGCLNLVEKCHRQHKPVSFTPGLSLLPLVQ